ncbi:hypothetical protein [Pseudomonas fluorescens]|uniref:hypothetical protein n=1 Tax=Pseudomonas fluorescens TaxID=294 RepID=UPI001BEB9407|nr:hypothetical protein [Pseudomonas fluorescens]MBT2375481.1 hypothetical protein [Pseudomonas fluorescens]
MHQLSYRQHKQILFYLLRRLPRFASAALDATGSGETLAKAADEFGHDRVLLVKLSRAWYGA